MLVMVQFLALKQYMHATKQINKWLGYWTQSVA